MLGNLRPDLVSFLPSMRQYAGNWASAIWAFAPGCEARLNELDKPARNQVDQLVAFGYEPGVAAVHDATGAGLAVDAQPGTWPLLAALPAPRRRQLHGPRGRVRLQLIVGWNFGDGHLHDEGLIFAVQRRLNFAPGELG